MKNNPYTEFAGEETKIIDGHKVGIRAYILPHISRITHDELEQAAERIAYATPKDSIFTGISDSS